MDLDSYLNNTAADDERFERWWNDDGSGIIPRPGDDYEDHAKRVARIAWSNGAYVAFEGLARSFVLNMPTPPETTTNE